MITYVLHETFIVKAEIKIFLSKKCSQFNDFEILFSSDLPKKRTKAYKTKKKFYFS